MERKGLDQVAYEAYGDCAGWKNYQGLPMPKWDDLPAGIKNAWTAAVGAVAVEIGKRVGKGASLETENEDA